MRIRFLLKYLLITIIGAIFAGCSRNTKFVNDYGVKYNHIRQKLGIPLIPANWKVEFITSNSCDFVNPTPNTKGPHRFMKRIFVNKDGVILSEHDVFYSGRSFYDALDGNTLSESISMEYDYSPSKNKNPWSIYLCVSPSRAAEEITKEKADEILKSWGFSLRPLGSGVQSGNKKLSSIDDK